jgi:hypothetical protein
MSRVCFGLLVAAVVPCLSGCGGPKLPPGAQPTKKVSVIVMYKGAPLEGASVTFVNQEGAPAPAVGKTDAQGKAIMKTYIEGDGAVFGKHKVMIDKSEAYGGQTVEQDSPDYNPNAPPPKVKHHIPQKYADYANSGLTAEVTESGPSEFTFDLKD